MVSIMSSAIISLPHFCLVSKFTCARANYCCHQAITGESIFDSLESPSDVARDERKQF